MVKRTKNQVHKPDGGSLRKIYFKNSSGSSMLVFKDLTPENAYTRKQALENIYHDWKGKFIVTR